MKYIETFPRTGYLIAVIFVLFITQNLHSQYDWSTPLALTDSVSNNTNVDIKFMLDYPVKYLFMAWEKSSDSTSTSIYFRDLLSTNTEIELLSDDSVHYTNPKFMSVVNPPWTEDTLFYLFYETDQNGNKDIYYLAYSSDGNFGEPMPFFVTPYQDFAVDCQGPHIVWIQDDDLKHTRYEYAPNSFLDPVSIDEGGCINPIFGDGHCVLWEKKIDSLSHIYGSHHGYGQNWADPIVIYDSGYAVNLNHSPYGFHRLFTFSAYTDSTWKLFSGIYNLYSPWIYFKEYDIQQNKPFDPAISIYKVGQWNLLDHNYISFPYEENENEEIYMNLDPFVSNFTNLSNSSTNNRNTNFFLGTNYETDDLQIEVYNVWESFRNNHWQLYYSKSLIDWVEVNEISVYNQSFSISPNPFKSTINISYLLKHNSLVNIEVYDLQGKKITTVLDKYQYKGEQNIKWNFPAELPSGIYFIILSKDNERYSQKIIKSD
ncbi:MAG: hypothetical protein DRH21_07625 [Deltaproteobacteria bacterium]|nr:MAG: hypothetical protein DRH21_07625 [Deltaproteobacteria bacterium]